MSLNYQGYPACPERGMPRNAAPMAYGRRDSDRPEPVCHVGAAGEHIASKPTSSRCMEGERMTPGWAMLRQEARCESALDARGGQPST